MGLGVTSFRQRETQTSFLSFSCGKFRYNTFQKANDKGSDQPAQMCRLVSPFFVHKPEDRFSLIEAHISIDPDIKMQYAAAN